MRTEEMSYRRFEVHAGQLSAPLDQDGLVSLRAEIEYLTFYATAIAKSIGRRREACSSILAAENQQLVSREGNISGELKGLLIPGGMDAKAALDLVARRDD